MKDAEARSPREAAAAAAARRRRRPVMGCIAKISASFRKIWLSTLNLFHRHSQGTGFDKIYRDVQACGYGDVHVMWSILQQHSHQQIISHKLSSSQSFPSSSSSSSSSSSLSSSALHEALCPSSSL